MTSVEKVQKGAVSARIRAVANFLKIQTVLVVRSEDGGLRGGLLLWLLGAPASIVIIAFLVRGC